MKKRKGFGTININGKKFLFNWASNHKLIMYDENNNKLEIDTEIWKLIPDSAEYLIGLQTCRCFFGINKEGKRIYGTPYLTTTWHGKHKNGPEFGSWGKREARELYRKYNVYKKYWMKLNLYE